MAYTRKERWQIIVVFNKNIKNVLVIRVYFEMYPIFNLLFILNYQLHTLCLKKYFCFQIMVMFKFISVLPKCLLFLIWEFFALLNANNFDLVISHRLYTEENFGLL